jgi:hypothetical protein
MALEAVISTAMRRDPDHRYPSAQALLADLEGLGPDGQAAVDVSACDLSAEPPMTGRPVIGSHRELWSFAAIVAAGYVGLVALVLTITLVLR